MAHAKARMTQMSSVIHAEKDAVKGMSDWAPEASKTSMESSHVSI